MTLTQLQAFVAAAALRSFTAAAAELKMSQPAVSDLIRRLEQELETPLFHRASRTLVLTAAGEQLLPHAETAVAAADQGRRAVRSQLELDGGIATFGLLRNADFYLKADLAQRFRREHPRVRIRLVGQNSAETAADVASGVLEAGLVTLPIVDDGLELVPLLRDELVYVTADPSRAVHARAIEDLLAAPLVLYDAHYATVDPARRQLDERAQIAGGKIEPEIEVEYLTTAISLVREGFGDSIICRAAVSPLIDGGLHTVSFQPRLYDTIALVKRRGAVLSPATREMARMAVDSLLEHQDTADGTAELIVSTPQLARFFRH
ncbi:LysR family transcriptional regulator [Agromyces sp. SYSU T00266]|uniref:LysR family transcriptional regulator n=1 Tax=Agromyces zhanjiangensis TaxID=3158562 RepID=UPI003397B9A1